MNKKPTKEEFEEVYNSDMKTPKIAAHFGVCRNTINAWRKSFGIEPKKGGNPALTKIKPAHRPNKINIEE